MKVKNLIYAAAGGLIVLLLAAVAAVVINAGTVDIPKPIKNQLSFNPVLPQKNTIIVDSTKFSLDAASFKYDRDEEILTYELLTNGGTLTITEQAYPEILVYDKLVGAMRQYDEVATKLGKVALTRPENLAGKQTAVLSTYNGTSGVLLFMKPDGDLTKEQWRQLVNNLRVHNE